MKSIGNSISNAHAKEEGYTNLVNLSDSLDPRKPKSNNVFSALKSPSKNKELHGFESSVSEILKFSIRFYSFL
jgi:hypothetical protein